MKEGLVEESHSRIGEVVELVIPNGVANQRVEDLKHKRARLHEALARRHPRLALRVGARGGQRHRVVEQLEHRVLCAPEHQCDAAATLRKTAEIVCN
eukprot:6826731-Prymnesium_polylepis.2